MYFPFGFCLMNHINLSVRFCLMNHINLSVRYVLGFPPFLLGGGGVFRRSGVIRSLVGMVVVLLMSISRTPMLS